MVTKYVDILMIWWYDDMGVYHVHVQYMVWYPQSKRKHCKSKRTLLWKDHMSIFKVMVKVLLLATRREKETASTAKMVGNSEFQSFFGCKYLETSFQLKHACFLSLVEFWDQQGSIWMFLWLGQVLLQLHDFCSVTHHQYKAHSSAPSSRLTQGSLAWRISRVPHYGTRLKNATEKIGDLKRRCESRERIVFQSHQGSQVRKS